jgi:hypothetical protein
LNWILPETPAGVPAPPATVLLASDFQPEPVHICSVSEVALQRIAPLMLEAQVSALPETWMASEAEMVPLTSSLAMGLAVLTPTLPVAVSLIRSFVPPVLKLKFASDSNTPAPDVFTFS